MGLIKKKTAVRTTEGGIKYICDVCAADITSTVCTIRDPPHFTWVNLARAVDCKPALIHAFRCG